jgi:hypothetical protein
MFQKISAFSCLFSKFGPAHNFEEHGAAYRAPVIFYVMLHLPIRISDFLENL